MRPVGWVRWFHDERPWHRQRVASQACCGRDRQVCAQAAELQSHCSMACGNPGAPPTPRAATCSVQPRFAWILQPTMAAVWRKHENYHLWPQYFPGPKLRPFHDDHRRNVDVVHSQAIPLLPLYRQSRARRGVGDACAADKHKCDHFCQGHRVRPDDSHMRRRPIPKVCQTQHFGSSHTHGELRCGGVDPCSHLC